ncbi:hypothetical protein BGW37DRAFT_507650 [Umbelopsis sp. PMI_123]|nr:hypothetical protein BGW37DRAFT_507650 [Umbelopsis sp. PMI_123]
MTITVSPGCAITAFVQPLAGNAVCTGNYVETMGVCQMTAIDESFGATCDSTGVNCVLSYSGGTSHALTCNGSSQSYTSALGVSFSGTCTCTLVAAVVGSTSAAVAASSSVPAPAGSAATSTQPAVATATVKSNAVQITKSAALFAVGIISAMIVTMA